MSRLRVGLGATGLGLALLAAAPAAEAQRYTFITKWGTQGARPGQLNFIPSLATDGAANVYVADGGNSRVQVFNPSGRLLRQWPASGSEIAVDPSGNVYVDRYDPDVHFVQKFSSTGALITQWPVESLVEALATDRAGNVYVANSAEISKFTPSGTLITQWGGWDGAQEPFLYISGLATDAAGNVYAANGGPAQVQKFTSTGGFLTQWGRRGSANGQIRDSHGIATDGADNVYVVDGKNQRVQKFTSNGRFLSKWGSCCSGNGRFRFPRGIATGTGGAVYVAGDYRIQKFGPAPAKPRARTCTKPERRTSARRACFRFRSASARVRFQCRMTGQRVPKRLRRWRRCGSPKRYRGLRPGRKSFEVRALSGAGAKSKPARYLYRVVG